MAIAGTLGGYQVISFLPEYLGLESREVTIPFRAAMCVLYVLLVVFGLCTQRVMTLNVPTLALWIFWILYAFRLLMDTVIAKVPLSLEPQDYIIYFSGLSLLPMLAFLRAPGTFPVRSAFRVVLVMHTLTSVLSIMHRYDESSVALSRMTGNESLNSISLGHTGVALLLMALILWLHQRRGLLGTWLWNAGYGALGLLGLYVVFFSSSRGAFLALGLLLPIALWSGWRMGARLQVIVVALCTLAVIPSVIQRTMASGTDLGLYVGSREALLESESATSRYTLIADAWSQFLQHPLLGSSLVERNSLIYPHNYVVESFMATGVVGGLAFCVVLLFCVGRCLRWLRHEPPLAWVALIFLQTLLGGLFSGALYSAPAFWSLLGIVLSIKTDHYREEESDVDADADADADARADARADADADADTHADADAEGEKVEPA